MAFDILADFSRGIMKKKFNVKLQDAVKGFTLDQDKIIPPEETVAFFKNKLKQVNLDILDKTLRIDNGRLDIPVFFSTCGKDALDVIGTKKQMGKGATPAQSEASAVMELAERFSFFSFYKNPANFLTEVPKNLKKEAISFDLIAQSVHDDSQDLDLSKKIYDSLPLKWTPAYNLTRQKQVMVPLNWFYTINEFNGPSAGNCVEEALSQGISELIERHVCSVVSHQKIKTPLIRPESATDPVVKQMLAKYEKAGIKIYLSDFTLEMGIPTVGVLAWDPSTFPHKSEIIWTAGTTPCPQKALSRALTETAQLAGDFNSGSNYEASGLPKFTRLEDAQYVIEGSGLVDIGDLPDLSDNNIRIEVESCIQALKNRNHDVLVVDTMHPLLQIPAFYTIIPGAHFRERSMGTSVAMFAAKIAVETLPAKTAAEQLAKMDQLMPDKYYIKFYNGQLHLNAGNPDNALDFFQKAIDLNPTKEDIPAIYSYMGVCLKDMGKFDAALNVLKKGEAYDRERTDIYNLMGFCNFMLKNHKEAIENFEKVIQLNPSSAIDYANIASNYRDMGKKDKAIRYYKLALDLDPSIEFARTNLEKLSS